MAELLDQIKLLKTGCSADCSGILAEMIKVDSHHLRVSLLHLLNGVLRSGLTPSQWKQTVLVVIFKDGDAQLPKNYRPISIIPIIYKLFSRLLLARVRPILDAAQSRDQAGFRSGFSVEDHLFTTTLLFEKSQEWQASFWCATLDFKKAFDTVHHSKLWDSLRQQGLPECYVALLARLYASQTAQVNIGGILSREFGICRGVRQGDPISPTLFNAALEAIMVVCKAKWQCLGYGLDVADKLGEYLTNLRFADDVILFASSLAELHRMLADVIQEARSFGLELHPDKTKILSNVRRRRGMESWQYTKVLGMNIDILPLEGSTKYLGRLLGFSAYHENEISHRINMGWKKFRVYKHILCLKSISLQKRLKLFDQTITPTVLYGSSTWTMKEDTKQKLKKTQRHMLRTILQHGRRRLVAETSSNSTSSSTASSSEDALESWVDWIKRVTAEVEHECARCGIDDWVDQQRKMKLRWAGHLARRLDERWAKVLLNWSPDSQLSRRRMQGHPKKRWADDVEVIPDWKEKAQDRAQWRLLTERMAT